MNSHPIGLFDSGLGGLSIMKALQKVLPLENMVYIADQAHAPFGNKPASEIIAYSQALKEFLVKKNVKLILIACHTASAHALKTLSQSSSIPILGVIETTSKLLESTKKPLLLATEQTLASKIYQKTPLIELACPDFVSYIEKKERKLPSLKTLSQCKDSIDSAILACTHFPLVKPLIQKALGESVMVIDPAEAFAQDVFHFLKKMHLLKENDLPPKYEFFTTGALQPFLKRAEAILRNN